ncbi:hypothetical protein GIB67_007018 [Kingdonia uniflora]|uniref:tyrosine--tRNA ligase n=1 Tax=Kingdonia uniflora TaxID=39325 RepID=A0A7J7NZ82_9MAGN|nr:hypothetical protein GIB67_007018 [Kingdonia uniflora]
MFNANRIELVFCFHPNKVDIFQLGMDQHKVNVLAREYCDVVKRKNKHIILSHHMLPGLKEGQEKMSKSDTSSSIYMEDEEAEVNAKIKKAYCPPKIVDGNSCLEYIKHLIFPWFVKFEVEQCEENGGSKLPNFIVKLLSVDVSFELKSEVVTETEVIELLSIEVELN